MGFPGTQELILILCVVLLLFGGKKLPELARSIGKAVSEFRKGTKEIVDEIKSEEIEESKDDDSDQLRG